MVEKQSLETDHKIHVDETAALARTSKYTNHLDKEAIGTQLYPQNFQHIRGFLNKFDQTLSYQSPLEDNNAKFRKTAF
jgi:hypothetical protein